MADIVDLTGMRRASQSDAAIARAAGEAIREPAMTPLASVDVAEWQRLPVRAIEPNGYYLPDWELAVNATAPGRTGAAALAAWGSQGLTGLMPVISLRQAMRIPLPALVSAHPYGTLCAPFLDGETAEDAALRLMRAAREGGARALLLREVALDGAAMKTFNEEIGRASCRERV